MINNDADELWWPHEGDLATTLERVPADCGSVIIPRVNVPPLRELDAHPFERMIWRDVRKVTRSVPLPGKVAHRGAHDVIVHAEPLRRIRVARAVRHLAHDDDRQNAGTLRAYETLRHAADPLLEQWVAR